MLRIPAGNLADFDAGHAQVVAQEIVIDIAAGLGQAVRADHAGPGSGPG